MANDTYADAREELQVTASWFSLLGPFHTPASTSFLEEERTHGKIGPSLLSQHPSWGLGLVRESLSFMSSSGLYLDFTDEETDQTEMPAGEDTDAALKWGRTNPAGGGPQHSAWLMHPGQKLPFSAWPRRGEEEHWGAGVNPPPPHCPDEVICCFFSQGLTLSTSPTLVSHPSSRRMPAHLHLREQVGTESELVSHCIRKWYF